MSIDEEWANFISSTNDNDEEDEEYYDDTSYNHNNIENMGSKEEVPLPSDIYISTKTKISYLNTAIDLKKMFWAIDVVQYTLPKSGVIKKQIKFNCESKEELEEIQLKLKDEPYFEEHVITHIDNPNGRIKFKDIRKISIGISKKDIMSYRCKKKSAFYNCFVLILRMKVQQVFKEFHVKVFNTGKVEIPGVQSENIFELILQEVVLLLQPHIDTPLTYKEDTNETVLINSNFNCGFFINREALYDILKYKYNIQAIYDPCSYPGIQCKFYYNPRKGLLNNNGQLLMEDKSENMIDVSFMIFRTGSVLIVGKCDEHILMVIYNFLKTILHNEYVNICQKCSASESAMMKDKTKKIKRKVVYITVNA